MKYQQIEEILNLIDEPNGSICKRILSDNRKLFQTVLGSTKKWLQKSKVKYFKITPMC